MQGSVSQRLDSSANVIASSQFDAFGNRTSTDNSIDPYSGYGAQWGYYTYSEIGLQLLRYRYYDPETGRFLTRDPIGFDGGINLYNYTSNNPVNQIDPTGEIGIDNAIGAASSIATGYVIARLTGQCGWKDALADGATGAIGVGLFSKFRSLYRLYKLRKMIKVGGLIAKASQKGTQQFVGDNFAKIEIKYVGNILSPKGTFNPQTSWIPRARVRIAPGLYQDPFTGQTGPKLSAVAHIPLTTLPLTEAPAIGAAQGAANSVAKGCCK
jgi:RHS repeat-associated protein